MSYLLKIIGAFRYLTLIHLALLVITTSILVLLHSHLFTPGVLAYLLGGITGACALGAIELLALALFSHDSSRVPSPPLKQEDGELSRDILPNPVARHAVELTKPLKALVIFLALQLKIATLLLPFFLLRYFYSLKASEIALGIATDVATISTTRADLGSGVFFFIAGVLLIFPSSLLYYARDHYCSSRESLTTCRGKESEN